MSLQTSYRSSAYYEYYEDELNVFYEKKWDFLFDYNEEIMDVLLKFLKLKIQSRYVLEFEKSYPDLCDFRDSIHPKKTSIESFKPYFQVFEDRNDFLPNLSIVDLLFSQGPQSLKYL